MPSPSSSNGARTWELFAFHCVIVLIDGAAVKAYVLIAEIGQYTQKYRFWVHAVFLANEQYAVQERDRLNTESERERLQLAREEREHVLKISGKPHPKPEEALSDEYRNKVPYYKIEEKDAILGPTLELLTE
jgi:hypothetical protein